MSRPYELFVFDWDGTVIDTVGVIVDSIRAACTACGAPHPSEAVCRGVIGMGLQEAMARLAPGLGAADWEPFIEAYKRHFFAHADSVRVFPGMEELLREMHAKGMRLAVATGKSRRGLDLALSQTGLGDVFEETVTADETFSKPNPAMLEVLGERTGTDPRNMVMTGDSVHDLGLARNAGAAGVGVLWGAAGAEELSAFHPAALVSSVDELARVLGVR